jgi:hypothetical protein
MSNNMAGAAAGGSAVDNSTSFKEIADSIRQEFMGEINNLEATMTEVNRYVSGNYK